MSPAKNENVATPIADPQRGPVKQDHNSDSSTKSEKRRRRSMILPEAYDERAMPALKLARSSRIARRVGRLLAAMLVLGFLLVTVAPWQQSVRGSGSVIAFGPRDRTQTIEATTKGRIVAWGDGVFENAHVKEGDVIAEIRDLDESYADRLAAQVQNAKEQVVTLRSVIDANERNLLNARAMAETLRSQVRTYESVKRETIASADAGIDAAAAKVDSMKEKRRDADATLGQAEADYDRQKTLFQEKIASQLKFQQAEQKYKSAVAKVAQAQADVAAAEAALDEKTRERSAKAEKAQAAIEYATSTLNKAEGDIAKVESDVAKSNQSLQKAQKELIDAESKVARQDSRIITAPFDGFITEIMPNQGSAVLKEGDPICVIVPDTADRAVQILLDGNDAPLVSPGRHVRLQFEGWPAVQFAGWPSVAVGTFGGQVVSKDATDNGKGKFRILIRPDNTDVTWPDERYLRQGVRANGWVLLEKVPLWFEIWRNMNGFPPVVDNAPDKSSIKKPKLPK